MAVRPLLIGAGALAMGCSAQPLPPRDAPEAPTAAASAATVATETIPTASPSGAPAETAPAPPPPTAAADAGAAEQSAVPTFAEALSALRAADLAAAADVIEARVAQSRRKMKLEQPEGLAAARAALALLPKLPETRRLLAVMPKSTVELVRSVTERGVTEKEAEQIAAYLIELHGALDMENPAPLDENTSHVIGREWHQIDYRGEGMTWERQKSIYAPRGVPDFKTKASFLRFFRIESQAPYFEKLYRPHGSAP